jgi:predicted ATPase
MARIEGIQIRNFRALRDVTLGRLWNRWDLAPLTALTTVIGKNGVGKSSLFDAFGFLADCLKFGVEEACDLNGRGGFGRIRSQGQSGSIEFQVYYRETPASQPITYELSIHADRDGRPYVAKERLRQRRKGQSTGRPFSFLILENGSGVVWKGEAAGRQEDEGGQDFDFSGFLDSVRKGDDAEGSETEFVELEDHRKLGIATLGSLKQHTRISAFRRFIEGWYLSYFTPSAARSLPLAGPQKHLSVQGDNLGNVVQFMEREHTREFSKILSRIAMKIPGITKVDTHRTEDNRLLLRFWNQGFVDSFFVQQISDGTLKLFAYLLLLEDPTPPPFLCVEEPENGLYPKLLEILAREFRDHANRRGGSQLFVTTHQPYFVDALQPNEVWVLDKGDDGFSTVTRANTFPVVQGLVEEGLPLGGLWYSEYLEKE